MNLQPIHPASHHRIVKTCTSCGGDVRCDTGFADLDGAPFKAYMCASCAKITLGPVRAAQAHEDHQMAAVRDGSYQRYF